MNERGDTAAGAEGPPLYDHLAVCETYFFPHPTPPLPAATPAAAPVTLALPDDTKVSAFWSRPLRDAPTLLYFHGNGESISDQLATWPMWAREAGANIFFVDYPGYGASGGTPSFTSCRHAALAALRYLLDSGEVRHRVIVAGRSVGSIFALDAAARCPEKVGGLLLESGVADLWQRLANRAPWQTLGIRLADLETAVRRDFDHRVKLERLSCPVLVLHTRHDSLIPSWHGETLAGWAGDHLLRLVLFDEGDHNTIQLLNETRYRKHLAALVAACR